MKLLAIETTGINGTVACAENGRLIAESPLPAGQRSAQSLVPAIEAILSSLGWSPNGLDAVAAAIGPGSFTGLRVGVTTAKILAWSCKADLYGVNSLDASAWQIAAALPDLLKSDRSNPVYEKVLRRGAAFLTVSIMRSGAMSRPATLSSILNRRSPSLSAAVFGFFPFQTGLPREPKSSLRPRPAVPMAACPAPFRKRPPRVPIRFSMPEPLSGRAGRSSCPISSPLFYRTPSEFRPLAESRSLPKIARKPTRSIFFPSIPGKAPLKRKERRVNRSIIDPVKTIVHFVEPGKLP